MTRLGDICEKIGSGATPHGGKEAYCLEGISFVRSQNIGDFSFSANGLAHINNEQAKFEYRNSMFANNEYIIVETELELSKGNKEEIQAKMQEYANFRKEKQPIEYPSAGSTFKRQEGIITAKLIDECGLKGFQIGGAKVSEKHAGFVINSDNATAKDVIDLIKYIKEKVNEKYVVKYK